MDQPIVPSLTEPGVRYFLKETLKQCQKRAYSYHCSLVNAILLFLFLTLLGIILIYKKRTKPTILDLQTKDTKSRDYILNKIKQFQEERKKEENQIITNLPKFESNFVTLHKNYYKI